MKDLGESVNAGEKDVTRLRAAETVVQSVGEGSDNSVSRLTNGHSNQLVGSACKATQIKEREYGRANTL